MSLFKTVDLNVCHKAMIVRQTPYYHIVPTDVGTTQQLWYEIFFWIQVNCDDMKV